MRAYVFAAILAVLIYPLAWQYIRGDASTAFFTNALVGGSLSSGMVVNTVTVFYVGRIVAAQYRPIYRKLIIGSGGAFVSSLLSMAEILIVTAVITGDIPDLTLRWLDKLLLPPFITTWLALLLVDKFIEPLSSHTK